MVANDRLGALADMEWVNAQLTRNVTHALTDIATAARRNDFGDFSRTFPIAGSKWTIEHTPITEDNTCVGYKVKLTQDWRTGHVPAHFDVAKRVLGIAGYAELAEKLNTITAVYRFQ